ncbi:MAG: glycosyltransferase [Bacteroidota bacterium]|nr:glycosyltransferase [Bacteroidota bacterium]
MKRVLVAPLDWGLGHTARCIPIIQELITAGSAIYFAGTKSQISFVKQHQLSVHFIELFGYNVEYSAVFPQWIKVGFQSLRLAKLISKENEWLQKFVKENKIDIVISDNRYGLHCKQAKSIFITHQLNIPSPVFRNTINNINQKYIELYDECWIPDSGIHLSGDLSKEKTVSIPLKRIGILSRFNSSSRSVTKVFDFLFLLSGVEPQRSIFEKKLIDCFKNTNYKVALIRGTETINEIVSNNIQQFGLLNANELKEIILKSDTVICRSGYSSIMDLVCLHKKMFLVPTPGQPEQEYLAHYLHEKFGVPYALQNELNESIPFFEAKKIEAGLGIKNENLLKENITRILNNE